MSTRRHVSTLGQPYFAFTAEDVGDRDTLPTFGLIDVALEFRVESLPVQNASPDELHPIFAFDHDLPTQPGILEIGVTPSGRFKAAAFTGSFWQTAPSTIANTDTWNTLEVGYDGGSGQWFITLNGVADNSTIDPSPAFLLPQPGYGSRLMLFNGRSGISRSHVSVRQVTLSFLGGSGSTFVSYTPTTRQDGTLQGVVSGLPMPANCDMAAEWYNPLLSPPWGAVPSGYPDGAFAFGLETDWTRLPQITTTWTRVA